MPGRTTGIVARLSSRQRRPPAAGPRPATGRLDTICPIVLSGGAAGAVHVFAQGARLNKRKRVAQAKHRAKKRRTKARARAAR
jgi:hypothetical protein